VSIYLSIYQSLYINLSFYLFVCMYVCLSIYLYFHLFIYHSIYYLLLLYTIYQTINDNLPCNTNAQENIDSHRSSYVPNRGISCVILKLVLTLVKYFSEKIPKTETVTADYLLTVFTCLGYLGISMQVGPKSICAALP
jgi:hypothetical protein